MTRNTLVTKEEVDSDASESTPPPHIETHFSWIRTRMGAERTLEAWVRTAVSLIGFGFTIVQFFERLNTTEGFKPPKSPFLTRYVGLLLIAAGTLGLVAAIWQYEFIVRYLHSDKFVSISQAKGAPRSVTVYIAAVLCLIGLFAFVSIITRAT